MNQKFWVILRKQGKMVNLNCDVGDQIFSFHFRSIYLVLKGQWHSLACCLLAVFNSIICSLWILWGQVVSPLYWPAHFGFHKCCKLQRSAWLWLPFEPISWVLLETLSSDISQTALVWVLPTPQGKAMEWRKLILGPSLFLPLTDLWTFLTSVRV